MKKYHLAEKEGRFADLIWENAPITSPELVKLCEKNFNWKKLCNRGIFQNEKALVTAVITKEEFTRRKTRDFVERSFGGSLPEFLTAFMGDEKLTESQAEEIKRLIDSFKANG